MPHTRSPVCPGRPRGGPLGAVRREAHHHVMATQHQPHVAPDRVVPAAQVRAALVDRDAHCRQRELVRLSLLACPGAGRPTHRRWSA